MILMEHVMYWSKDVVAEPVIVAGSAVLVLNEQGHILLQREMGTVEWRTIGGIREASESLEDTAARNLYEETGLQADSYEFITLISGTDMNTNHFNHNEDENYDILAIFKVQVLEDSIDFIFTEDNGVERKYFSLQEPLPCLDSLTQYICQATGITAGHSEKN